MALDHFPDARSRRASLVLASLAVVSLSATAMAQAPKWRYLHGGTTHGIWLALDDRGATAEDGGRVRRTTDGLTWSEADTPNGIRGMLRGVMYIDPSTAYCVGDDGAVLKSEDGGGTWARINTANPITSLKTDALSNPLDEPARLYDIVMFDEFEGYAVGDDGVLVYTDDEWATWTDLGQIAAGEDPVDMYDLYMWDADTGVFVGDYGTILRMTTSLGVRSWTLPSFTNTLCVGNSPTHVLDWWSVAFDGNDGWVVGGYDTNYGVAGYSTDGGQTWDQVQYVVPLNGGMMAAMKANGASTTLYGFHLGSGDPEAVGYGGTTWEFSMSGIGSGVDIFDQCDPQNDFDTGTASPVLICTGAIVETPTNGSPPHIALFAIDATDKWLSGRFGRIARWDGVSDWDDQSNVNYNRLQAGDFEDEDIGCVIGQGNIIRRTTDAGATWSVVYPTVGTPDAGDFGADLDMASNGYAVAIGSDSFFGYSTNSGSSWTIVASGNLPSGWQPSMNACAIAPGSTIAYVGGPGGTAFKVDLAGSPLSWTSVTVTGMASLGEHLLDMAWVNSNVGYAVGTERTAYVTSNGGTSWAGLSVSGTGPGVDFHAVAAWGTGTSDAVAVGTRGNVYKLTSGTFSKMTLGAAATLSDLNDVVALDSGAEFMIAGDGGTMLRYVSSTWSSLKSTTGENLYSLSFDADDHGFAIGQQFMILEYD